MVPVEPPLLFGFGGVAAGGRSGGVDLGGPKQRAVLALLMLEPGSVVPLDRLVDRVWAGAPPAKAEASVRGYVSNLRKALAVAGVGSDRLVFRDRGYVLEVAPELIDLHLFDVLVDGAAAVERDGDLLGARRLLTRAVDLYAGPPLGALAEDLGLVEVTARYEQRRGEAIEALTEVRLALGEHAQLPAALASEIARQPYRERLRAQLALALYRAGRPVEALRSISEARRLLAHDVGVEPGPELRRAEAAILAHDEDSLAWVPPPSPAGTAPIPRPTVAHVVADVEDEERFGRAGEEARAQALLDRLVGRGGVLVVDGGAGIGKSTLLRALRAEAQRRGFVVGWDRCPESAAGAPYRSWRVAAAPLSLDGSLHTAAPALDQEHGAEREAAGALLATHLGELDRLRARTEPAVLVIDDLQWAEGTSRCRVRRRPRRCSPCRAGRGPPPHLPAAAGDTGPAHGGRRDRSTLRPRAAGRRGRSRRG